MSDSKVTTTTDTTAKPEVTIPDGAPQPGLGVTTVVEGDGALVKAGDAVTVHYAGWNWSNKTPFDASWDRGQPFTVAPIGRAGVIDGWNEGMIGAKVGERRLLVIPPEKGYGPAGAAGVIPPNETLVFVIDVVGVK
ncbi:FKBP-type peptidyl-prolyl cis-trans isomerase [Salininema proteolyticum]|uniref:Peptidyl-prolyl cis-trans isomerase n=1 Tax=Salininema proteolyticum TaxID=1607685 RepID=A0ABV8U538_9ACTN